MRVRAQAAGDDLEWPLGALLHHRSQLALRCKATGDGMCTQASPRAFGRIMSELQVLQYVAIVQLPYRLSCVGHGVNGQNMQLCSQDLRLEG